MRKPPTHSSGPICATVAVVILAQLAGTGSAAAQIIVGSVARSASADLQIVVAAGGRLPRSVEGWRNDPSILQFVVSNTGTTDLEDLHLSFRVNGTSRGEIVRSAEGHPAQIRFVVSAYETRPFFWDEVLSTEAITAASGIAGSFVRDGIPEDSYQLCASLIDAAGNNITSGQERCVFLRISDPDPPSLVFPTNEANVTAEAAMFQWTPVDADQVSYRLVVKPRFEGQTAGEAMQVNGILLETETAGSSYTYLPSDPPFDTFANADSWVWQVRSLSNDEPVGRNEGFSRIEGFRTSRSLTGVAELRDPPTVVIPTCGQDDRPPQPANRTPSTTAGPDFIGRRVNVGFFQMEITDAQGDGVSLSGSGTIDVPFFETSVPVRFSGLAVNTDSEVFDGVITTANEETARVPLTWSNAEVVIRNVSFRPTGAVLDAALEFSVPSVDVVAGFAAAALTFYPTGVNSRTARLGLPQDVSIPFGNGALRLMGVTSEGAGSYAEWTCNGLERIQLTVQQDFSREWLQPVDGSGAVLPGAVTATYQVALSAESGRFEATGRIPRTQIGGAPGFILDEADVILDFSTDTNPEGLVYPEGYLGDTSPRWQGVYMPSFRLSLPDAIRSYGRTEPVTTTADRLIIDRSGVTVSLGLENILTLATGDLGGWSYSIDRFGLDIVSGSMKEGSMSGQVIVPIGDQPLTYTARLTPVRKPGSDVTELAFDFQIQPSGELRASLFGDTARMTLSPTSRITVEVFKEGDKRVFRPKAILNGTFGIATKVALAGVKFEGFTLQTVDPYVQKGTWSFASPQHYLGGDRPLFLNGSLPMSPLRDRRTCRGAAYGERAAHLDYRRDGDRWHGERCRLSRNPIQGEREPSRCRPILRGDLGHQRARQAHPDAQRPLASCLRPRGGGQHLRERRNRRRGGAQAGQLPDLLRERPGLRNRSCRQPVGHAHEDAQPRIEHPVRQRERLRLLLPGRRRGASDGCGISGDHGDRVLRLQGWRLLPHAPPGGLGRLHLLPA